MRPAKLLLSLLLLSVSASLLPLAHPAPAVAYNPCPVPVPASAVDICSRTDYPEICIDSIECRFPDDPVLTVADVFGLSNWFAIDRTMKALDLASTLGAGPQAPPPFGHCISIYNSTIGGLYDSANAGNWTTTKQILTNVMAKIRDCDTALGKALPKNPMAEANQYITKLGGIALALTQMGLEEGNQG